MAQHPEAGKDEVVGHLVGSRVVGGPPPAANSGASAPASARVASDPPPPPAGELGIDEVIDGTT